MTYTPEETLFLAVVSRLTTAQATTLSYVKQIYQGDRQIEATHELPCIILDIDSIDEEWVEMPQRRQITMNISIRGAIDVRTRLNQQIVGDSSQVGILRFESDIKKVFEGSDIDYADTLNNYSLRTEHRKLIDNAVREVKIILSLKMKFFSVGERI